MSEPENGQLALAKQTVRRREAAKIERQNIPTRAREAFELSIRCPAVNGPKLFTVVFYGVRNFCCKTTQSCATQRQSKMAEIPSVRNDVQRCENTRKKFFFN